MKMFDSAKTRLLPRIKTSDGRVIRFTPPLPSYHYTPIYEPCEAYGLRDDLNCGEEVDKATKGEINFASLNAGDTALYVGGGAINRAFSMVLEEAGHRVDAYQATHKATINAGEYRRSGLRGGKGDDNLIVSFASVVGSAKNAITPRYPVEGVCIVDVFKKGKSPKSDPYECNMGMVYVVGPKDEGEGTPQYLGRVKAMAENIQSALLKYNRFVIKASKEDSIDGLRPINLVRICGVSMGMYRPRGIEKLLVADKIIEGLFANSFDPFEPQYEFAYDFTPGDPVNGQPTGWLYNSVKRVISDGVEERREGESNTKLADTCKHVFTDPQQELQ
eukprot:GHVN01029823.1.p1 GENE.GHVN01029823.1~~GHVN01029823.1.p1  ORF type:complete len:366 (+),score=60.71 GHVN01029823.1:103-1098(+)